MKVTIDIKIETDDGSPLTPAQVTNAVNMVAAMLNSQKATIIERVIEAIAPVPFHAPAGSPPPSEKTGRTRHKKRHGLPASSHD